MIMSERERKQQLMWNMKIQDIGEREKACCLIAYYGNK